MCTDSISDFSVFVNRLAGQANPVLNEALRTGGIYADLFAEQTAVNRLSIFQRQRSGLIGVPDHKRQERSWYGAGVHVFNDQKEGYAATDKTDGHSLIQSASLAAGQIEGTSSTRCRPVIINTALQGESDFPMVPGDGPDNIHDSEKKALVRSVVESAFSLDDRVTRVKAVLEETARCIMVATSDGTLITEKSRLIGLRITVNLTVEGREIAATTMAGGKYGFGYFSTHPPEFFARETVQRAKAISACDTRIRLEGRFPVVIAGGWGGVWLHEAVGHMLEADMLYRQSSAIDARIGDKITASNLTLVDDPTLPGGRGSIAFDDEGAPSRRTTLIKNGRLCGFLTDRRFSRLLQLPHTGHGRRQDYRSAPLPRMTNLLLQPGNDDPECFVADVRKGIFVKTIGHGMVLPDHKSFTFDILEGYFIENGCLSTPVSGFTVAGNISEMLARIVGIGNDFLVDTGRGVCEKAGQTIPISIGMPTMYISEFNVHKASGEY